MRVVFLGTADFACPALSALAHTHEIVRVITQPDRPVGRHAELRPSPVKVLATELGLPLSQPEKINAPESLSQLEADRPDVLIVAAYGQLLREGVFQAAPHGAINIHGSLLPAYRGAAPVQWAVIRGETETGVTTFVIDRGMDTGDLLLKRSATIDPDETAGALMDRLAELGAEAIVETLEGLASGALHPVPQPAEGISLAPRLSRDDGRIDWQQTADTVHNLVRGTSPWPSAWTQLDTDRVKVHATKRTGIGRGTWPAGTVVLRETGRMLVACNDELLEVLEIQRQGRPRTSGQSFVNGLRAGAVLG